MRTITNWDMVPLFLTTEETAMLLGLSTETVKRMLQSGKMEGIKIGRKWRIRKEYLMNNLPQI